MGALVDDFYGKIQFSGKPLGHFTYALIMIDNFILVACVSVDGFRSDFLSNGNLFEFFFRLKGMGAFRWNGTNDAGLSAASGIYFVRVSTEKWTETNHVVLIR